MPADVSMIMPAGLVSGVTIKFQSFLSLILAIIFVLVMAAVSDRLLGVRTSRGRRFFAALLGCGAGIAGAYAASPRHNEGIRDLLALLFGVLGTMVLIVVLEALRSPRSRGRRRRGRSLLHPIRWVRRKFAPVGRTLEVLRFARRRGLARFQFMSASAVATGEFGHRLRLTLEDCGGMFVKFGQIASTRSDLLADPVIEELSHLRASVRPIPSEQLRPLVEGELGRPVEEVFSSFEWEPLAAASIGQTHRAVLATGEHVVVKIQRPGLDELLERDATVLRLVSGMAERRIPGARVLGLRNLASDLIIGMERELDYHREAAMARRLAEASSEDALVNIPAVYDEVSGARLLVMEEVVGRSVDDALALSTCGVPREHLAQGLLRAFLRQVIQGGAYHADPHPGNIFVDDLGRLWLLDFGAVGLLDPISRESLQEIALGLSLGEPQLVARAVRRMSGADVSIDLRPLEAEIGMLMVETNAGQQFDPAIIGQVLSLMGRYGLRAPSGMLQLSRALLTLDGTLRIIDPGVDLASEATALVREVTHVEPEASGQLLERELLRALPILRELPSHVEEVATQLRGGRLTVRTEHFAGEDARVVGQWVDGLLVFGVGAGGGLMSALMLLASTLSRSVAVTDALRALGFIGIVLSGVLLLRTVAQAFQRRR